MKIGFACKIHSEAGHVGSDYNFNTTTLRHLRTLDQQVAYEKIEGLFEGNLTKLQRLVGYVVNLPQELRMLRLSGDLLPMATHPDYQELSLDLLAAASSVLSSVGEACRAHGVRISFHPGQFTVLGSNNENVIAPSIAELEYHAKLLTMMGYSGWHDHGCAINIHAGSRNVPLTAFRQNLARLSPECQNFLTVENDEFSYGLDQLTSELGDAVAIVPDLHHEWIYRRGYITAEDPDIERAVDSWRGVRPKLHCAMSRIEYFSSGPTLPDINALMESGLARSKLRQHSDDCWNIVLCDYYYPFWERFDIMVEAKFKQVAARQLYNRFQFLQTGVSNV